MIDAGAKTSRPKPPEHVDGEALLEWERICGELEQVGQDPSAYRVLLTLYVEAWQKRQIANRHVMENGDVVMLPNGFAAENPYAKRVDKYSKEIEQLLAAMRLTPASHKPPPPKDDQQEFNF